MNYLVAPVGSAWRALRHRSALIARAAWRRIRKALFPLFLALLAGLGAITYFAGVDHYSIRFGSKDEVPAPARFEREHFLQGLSMKAALKSLRGFSCPAQPPGTWPLKQVCSLNSEQREWRYEVVLKGADQNHLTSVTSTLHGPSTIPAVVIRDWAARMSSVIANEKDRASAIDVIHQATRSNDFASFVKLVIDASEDSTWYLLVGRDYDRRPTASLLPTGDVVSTRIYPHGEEGEEDPLGPPTLTPLDQALFARSFAPILRFDHEERFYPLAITSYAAQTELCEFRIGKTAAGKRLHKKRRCKPRSVTNLKRSLPELEEPWFHALDIPDVEPTAGADAYEASESKMREHSERPVVYWHVVPARDSDHIFVQYWFFYSYNDFKNQHEGDWEMIALEFDFKYGSILFAEPARIAYSAHTGYSRPKSFKEGEVVRDRFDAHPIVYIAPGSHANYFERRRHDVVQCWPPRFVSVCAHTTEADSDSRSEITPSEYELQRLPGRPFRGRYGPANYLLRGWVLIDRGPAEDPRLKPVWDNPLILFPTE